MSTSSASAATIFDLVIGFPIESILQRALAAPGRDRTLSKRRDILHAGCGAVSTGFPGDARDHGGQRRRLASQPAVARPLLTRHAYLKCYLRNHSLTCCLHGIMLGARQALPGALPCASSAPAD